MTMYTPADPVQDRLDVAETPSIKKVGFREHAIPDTGETDCVRVTLPVKPFTALTVIIELA